MNSPSFDAMGLALQIEAVLYRRFLSKILVVPESQVYLPKRCVLRSLLRLWGFNFIRVPDWAHLIVAPFRPQPAIDIEPARGAGVHEFSLITVGLEYRERDQSHQIVRLFGRPIIHEGLSFER